MREWLKHWFRYWSLPLRVWYIIRPELNKWVLQYLVISYKRSTLFLQGTTIKKMVDILGVRRSEKRVKGMGEALNDRVWSISFINISWQHQVLANYVSKQLIYHLSKEKLSKTMIYNVNQNHFFPFFCSTSLFSLCHSIVG